MNARERDSVARTSKIMREARKKCGMTQVEVAKAMGISQPTLSKLEAGLLSPSAPDWFYFCQLTGIKPECLLTGQLEEAAPAQKK